MHLLIVDTAQIQPYIFGSNRLRENVGASYLVAQATRDWAFQELPTPHNVNLQNGTLLAPPLPPLAAQMIYAGGGNVVVLFHGDNAASEQRANEFTRRLSRQVLAHAPGLQLVIAQRPLQKGESLRDAIQATFQQLQEQNRARAMSSPLLGLSVTVMCQSTGLPAIGMTQPIAGDPTSIYPAAAEIHAKIETATRRDGHPSDADQRLHQLVPPPTGFDYPSDFDEMGGTLGEHTYIAVIHADGDGMADRIRQIGNRYAQLGQDADYTAALYKFSDDVSHAAQEALGATLANLKNRIDHGAIVHRDAAGKVLARIQLTRRDDAWLLPFRPIVFGGDDVTFVCDGRLGISLALGYMSQFKARTAKLDGGGATCCAGIAIVKTHYPFVRAYALAEDLCASAKKYRRQIEASHEGWGGACLDWHFALSGLSGDIDEIRRREYTICLHPDKLETVKEYSGDHLSLRPVALENNPQDASRTWNVIRAGIDTFQGETWASRRNKVKAFRDALREGPDAVEQFRAKFGIEEDDLPAKDFQKTGWWVPPNVQKWQGDYCGYWDALELSDWFIPL